MEAQSSPQLSVNAPHAIDQAALVQTGPNLAPRLSPAEGWRRKNVKMDFSKREIIYSLQPSRKPAQREGMPRGHERLLISPVPLSASEALLVSQEVRLIKSYLSNKSRSRLWTGTNQPLADVSTTWRYPSQRRSWKIFRVSGWLDAIAGGGGQRLLGRFVISDQRLHPPHIPLACLSRPPQIDSIGSRWHQ